MLERYYVRPDTVDRIRSSWISGAIDQYIDWLAKQEFSRETITRRIPLLVRFGEYAKAQGATAWADLPAQVEAFISYWLQFQGRPQNPKLSQERNQKFAQELQNPILQMLRLIIPELVGPKRPTKPENPFHQWAPDFFTYLRKEKGLREETIRLYSYSLRQFASYLESIGMTDVKHLSPPVLSGFVVEFSQRVGRAATRDACGRVRVLLRYLYRQLVLPQDLSQVVENPHTYRLSNIPRSITWDEVRRMLETVDRRTPRGKRDYAILLLLVTYGLRAREVAAITLGMEIK
jgi:integrase/recombinase XerD